MSHFTATATTELINIGLLIGFLAVITGCYALACWLYPFRTCRGCHGTGRRRAPIGRTFGLCRRCQGNGYRLRTGRRIANHIRQLRAGAR